MKKEADFYFDFYNKEQVEWWNKLGVNLSKIAVKHLVIDKGTNKQVGAFIWLNEGIFKEYVIKKMKEKGSK